jgi:hypothetical protein
VPISNHRISFKFSLFLPIHLYLYFSYNAIHDPTINMVATATMIEGSLDVLSCTTLLHLATLQLPPGWVE